MKLHQINDVETLHVTSLQCSLTLSPITCTLLYFWLFTLCGKANVKPNPLTPFPAREGGKIQASFLVGERFGEGFSRSREKSYHFTKNLIQM